MTIRMISSITMTASEQTTWRTPQPLCLAVSPQTKTKNQGKSLSTTSVTGGWNWVSPWKVSYFKSERDAGAIKNIHPNAQFASNLTPVTTNTGFDKVHIFTGGSLQTISGQVTALWAVVVIEQRADHCYNLVSSPPRALPP